MTNYETLPTASESATSPVGSQVSTGRLSGKLSLTSVLQTPTPNPKQLEQLRPRLGDLLRQLQSAKPGAIDATTHRNAELAVEFYDHVTQPAPARWTAARIHTLLVQTYVLAAEEIINEQVAEDWLNALESYPAWAIKAACDEWCAESHNGRKPTAGDIASLCAKQLALVRRLNVEAKAVLGRPVSRAGQSPFERKQAEGFQPGSAPPLRPDRLEGRELENHQICEAIAAPLRTPQPSILQEKNQ
jgi:hypothetical protein